MAVDLEALRTKLRLNASLEELAQLQSRFRTCLEGLDEGDRYALLLVAEREVLGAAGHRTTLKFGRNPYANAPPCIVCGGEVSSDDLTLTSISRWEQTQLWITFHAGCVADELLELDYDVLTGNYRSPLGPT